MTRSDYDLLTPFMTEGRARRIEDVLAARLMSLVLVVENLYDPHNLSAILRSADAFGIQRVLLAGMAPEKLNPLVSLGAEKWLTISFEPDREKCVADLRAGGYTIAASAPDGAGAGDLFSWEPRGPVALVLGNEKDGLSEFFLGAADRVVSLPMRGFSQSLNVSVAAGILMWELVKKVSHLEGGLCDQEVASLRDDWAKKSVDHSGAILERIRKG